MEIFCMFVLSLCFVWKSNGIYLSEDVKLSRKIRSTDWDLLYKTHQQSLQPGQVMPKRCAYAKYGCCKDAKTRAIGPNEKGCDMALCTDKYVQECYDKKKNKQLKCSGYRDSKNCPYSCNKCRAPAAPLKKCLLKKPVHGCCWNGKTPFTGKKSDCPPCINTYPISCVTFSTLAGGCRSGSFGVRNFMTKYCPDICGYCSEASMYLLVK